MEEKWLEDIQPALVELEQDRLLIKKAKSQWVLFIVLPAIAVGLMIAAVFPFPVGAIFGVVSSMLLSAVGYSTLVAGKKRSYVTAYKTKVVTGLLQQIGKDLRYDSLRGIGRKTFVQTRLFSKRPARYHTEDLIEGRHGKTELRFAEVVAKERRRQNKKTKYVTFFRGMMFIADFHKHLSGQTYVYPDTAENILGSFGRTLQRMGGNRGTQLIQLEDVTFEREFAVYSTDQIEARYVLSPAMMSRMVEMRKRLGRDIRVAFKDSCVYMAIPHTSNYLEPRTERSATNVEQVREMYNEIVWFLQIVDELDLNTRIWTKE